MRQVHGGGIGAPKNTPAEIVTRLNQEINSGLAGAEGQTRFAAFGVSVFLSSVVDFRQFIADETEKWAKVVKFTGIRADWSENFYH
jgi:tripartite-type tricarboxylate transporter receptor subunit TctC